MEDDHRHKNQECVTLNLGLKNSKVLSKDKHDLIVTALKDEADSKLSAKDKWTLKKKNYSLVNSPELNLTDVLCVPSKTKVSFIIVLGLLVFCVQYKDVTARINGLIFTETHRDNQPI